MPKETPNSDQSIMGRRLYPRFKVDVTPQPFFWNSGGPGFEKAVCRLQEIAKDSLVFYVSPQRDISPGDEIRFPHPANARVRVKGKVASCRSQAGGQRVIVHFTNQNMLDLFPNVLLVPSEQRQRRRGLRINQKTGQRRFDRRGFWRGLEDKRYFSEYIRELQNNDAYFFSTPLESGTGAHVRVNGRDMIMLSSNNYLGLSMHPRVREAAKKAIDRYGTSPSASSVLGGVMDIHFELEEALARFKGTEAACFFSAGYTTNLSTLLTVLNKGDEVFYDDKNHASLMDGARLSGARGRAYKHSDVGDLEKKLLSTENERKMVVTDTVFSMDGDIAKLPEIYRLCRKHGAALMVDEAHATGIYGPHGRGLLEHFEMEGKVEIVMGTLSKSLSALGGFICGSKELIKILKHSARAYVFSAAIPASVCATVLECLKIIDEEPERRAQLWRNARRMREGLHALGFNTGESSSPIIPVIFPLEEQTVKMTRGLREAGIFVSPAVYPAVKKNSTRVRVSVMATHTDQDIEIALTAFKKVRDISF